MGTADFSVCNLEFPCRKQLCASRGAISTEFGVGCASGRPVARSLCQKHFAFAPSPKSTTGSKFCASGPMATTNSAPFTRPSACTIVWKSAFRRPGRELPSIAITRRSPLGQAIWFTARAKRGRKARGWRGSIQVQIAKVDSSRQRAGRRQHQRRDHDSGPRAVERRPSGLSRTANSGRGAGF